MEPSCPEQSSCAGFGLAGVGWLPSVTLHYVATLTYVFVAGASYMFVALMKQALINEPLG